MDPVKRSITIKLTDEEIMARGDELVSVLAQRKAVEDEQREATKGFRKKLKGLDKDRDRLAAAIEQRAEEREVDCEARADYREGVVRYLKPGTEEVLEQRPLEPEERQMGIVEKPALAVMDGGKKKRGRPKKKTGAAPALTETPDPPAAS